MKVYVASKFENKAAVRRAQRLLRRAGHTITHDWTKEDASGKTGGRLAKYLRTCAEADERGVKECDAFVLLRHPGGSGMWIEFGMARAWGKPIVVVAGDGSEPIFFRLPNVVLVDSVEAAVREVGRLANGGQVEESAAAPAQSASLVDVEQDFLAELEALLRRYGVITTAMYETPVREAFRAALDKATSEEVWRLRGLLAVYREADRNVVAAGAKP